MNKNEIDHNDPVKNPDANAVDSECTTPEPTELAKPDTKKIVIKDMIILATIVGVCVLVLSITYLLTHKKIEEHLIKQTFEAQSKVLAASEFEIAEMVYEGVRVEYYVGKNNGTVAGYVFATETTGKNTGLKMLTGINTHGEVTGVEIIEEAETPGYVDSVKDSGMLNEFIGKKKATIVLVDAVSGATKSSDGIIDGVKLALAYYEQSIRID